MSLILEGINLPKGDESIKIEILPSGDIWLDTKRDFKLIAGGAVQIPNPHGRLGDLDKLNKSYCETWCKPRPNCEEDCAVSDEIWLAPTILKAEGSDENQI